MPPPRLRRGPWLTVGVTLASAIVAVAVALAGVADGVTVGLAGAGVLVELSCVAVALCTVVADATTVEVGELTGVDVALGVAATPLATGFDFGAASLGDGPKPNQPIKIANANAMSATRACTHES